MRKLVTALCLVSLTGCASIQYAIEATPRRVGEAFSDPIRRVHIGVQASRVASAAGIGITCAAVLAPTIVGVIVCPFLALLADYVTYEYVLEPASKELVKQGKPSLVGPYWETGPRSDEGELFVAP